MAIEVTLYYGPRVSLGRKMICGFA